LESRERDPPSGFSGSSIVCSSADKTATASTIFFASLEQPVSLFVRAYRTYARV
jgi:hypothetical protein